MLKKKFSPQLDDRRYSANYYYINNSAVTNDTISIKMVIVWYVLLDVKQYNATLLLSSMQDVLLDEDILLIGLGFSIQSVLHSSF